jgi:putative sterol carrier protein
MESMLELFTETGAQRWGEQLQRSEEYRKSAATWEGGLILTLKAPQEQGGDKAVFLDLWHGDCRQARLATEADREAAAFHIAAGFETWIQVLEGTIAPLNAIMRGKLKLEKGKLAALLPYAQAAKALVLAAVVVHSADSSGEAKP